MANRNPPRSTYCRTCSATAFFSAGTDGSPWRAGRRERELPLLDEPARAAVAEVELVLLAGEVLVEEVHPLVRGELAGEHLVVPHLLERDAGVGEGERDRVVPRGRARRGVDGDLGRLLERHRVHVAAGDLAPHPGLVAGA
jgi:hypothetical protein